MSTRTIAEQEARIKDSLFEFVGKYVPGADLSLVDEIVLSYVVAILEDVSSDPVFDVEGFCEMMAACLPGFGSINHATVCQWMFELEAKLRELEPEEKNRPSATAEITLPEIVPKIAPRSVRPSGFGDGETVDPPKRVHKISEMSDGGSTDSSCCDFSEEIDVLQEMFPHVCSVEVKHCLTIASGDVERATQILIDRQESGQCLAPNAAFTLQLKSAPPIDDAELKNRIIERYSYVDKDSFVKEHRPVAPKVEPKKLVRYRDNKIVSLKGERFTEVKKGEDVDEVSLRKPKKGHCP